MGAGLLQRHILGLRVVRGNHRAAPFEGRVLEELVVLASLINAARHQDGVASLAGQARLGAEVKHNVCHHTVHARLGAEHVLHRAPLFFQLFLLPVVQALGFGVKPLVNLVLAAQRLVNIPRLIHQVQHHAVFHRLAELVGVDVAAKHLQAGLLVFFEQRRAGKANEHRVGHHRLHHPVQLAALRAVALVHKHKHLAHGTAGLALQVGHKGVKVRIRLAGCNAKFVHQRTQQPGLGLRQLGH